MDQKKTLISEIRGEGPGAGARWLTIAASAMAGNQAAKAECARLLGRDVASLNDYWLIMTAAGDTMSRGELGACADTAQQALSAGKSAATEADDLLANRLGQLRRERGLTQQQLSTLSGVGLSTLQKLESGANRLLGARLEIAYRLAKALGVRLDELIGGGA